MENEVPTSLVLDRATVSHFTRIPTAGITAKKRFSRCPGQQIVRRGVLALGVLGTTVTTVEEVPPVGTSHDVMTVDVMVIRCVDKLKRSGLVENVTA